MCTPHVFRDDAELKDFVAGLARRLESGQADLRMAGL